MEAADLGSCPVCCCAIYLCGPCALAKARCAVAEKYGIEESGVQSCLLGFCCGCCSYFQVLNQILVKEDKTWGCCAVGAPDNGSMQR